MASIFTYQDEPPRVHSPWSTSEHVTPQRTSQSTHRNGATNNFQATTLTKLEPERQDGPTEYKLHLLLRTRGMNHTGPTTPGHATPQRHSSLVETSLRSLSDTALLRTAHSSAQQSRQNRLQQLTTQLLWRLQQSSPFHSSSNAKLVLPLLPEATPRLGVPERPARLLPGLEESQGALYEIGVADDGTLVGLVEEELEESLNNLRAMAASLGCVVDILRRVLVNQADSARSDSMYGLWVAEVLVRPDTRSPVLKPLEDAKVAKSLQGLSNDADVSDVRAEVPQTQIRVTVIGASSAGKSSLVGTLTTSTLDNGRGKSRLSLLKHRHEIASGVTSSVAQELLGYAEDDSGDGIVVNYAVGDVSSWPDIHNLASRLVFLSDSPGLPRYAKSTFRTLVSWKPCWTVICAAADEDPSLSMQSHEVDGNGAVEGLDLTLAHLDLCLKLDLPLLMAVTKMDLATKSGLRPVLSKILSVLKQAGRTPILLAASSTPAVSNDENSESTTDLAYVNENEKAELRNVLQKMRDDHDASIVPIVLTSAVSGTGFGKLHALLRQVPVNSRRPDVSLDNRDGHETGADLAVFHIDETFAIPPSKVYSAPEDTQVTEQGVVLCGHIMKGKISVGDRLRLGPFWVEADSAAFESDSPRTATIQNETGRRLPVKSSLGEFSKSLQGDRIRVSGSSHESGATFVNVQVVSLRSLRLPVTSMSSGETGTVGIHMIDHLSKIPLDRTRKGMVLSSQPLHQLAGYRKFTCMFHAAEFAALASPPLILGGHAIVYVNSIRAAVKVTAVTLDMGEPAEDSSPAGFFGFDEDSMVDSADTEGREVRITFRFVSSVEWMEVNDMALIVPTMSAAGPVSGPLVAMTALSGFVGRIVEVSI